MDINRILLDSSDLKMKACRKSEPIEILLDTFDIEIYFLVYVILLKKKHEEDENIPKKLLSKLSLYSNARPVVGNAGQLV
jgi:hypothetical protein